MRHTASALAVVFLGIFMWGSFALAADTFVGWEADGEYSKMYDVAEYDKIKGSFVELIDVTPLPGMAVGSAIVVKDRADGEDIVVHVAPKGYIHEQLEALNLRPGQKIKIYGAWVEIDGHDVLMATKIKKTENEFVKVRRTKDGFPFWNMTPEEIAKELADS
ncbi:MAG: hypothetical protein ACNI3A_09075 [Desulfovibrio sp.]|uniref:hypothetical protein n=1 Tax=Desulfovibrio sp. 7SRBS1 TaxID=3378064 RepID=UPI003B404481